MLRTTAILLACCILCCGAYAQTATGIQLTSLFGDNMVLQAGEPINIWGTASPGGEVLVQLGKHRVSARADEQGKWSAKLPAMPYGGPYQLVIQGRQQIVYHNVMVGEVWLMSGQSNMGFTMEENEPVHSAHLQARQPMVREFSVPAQVHQQPMSQLQAGSWNECNPASVKDFSAMAYYFARQLHLDRKVAVGIIRATWGGTRIHSWMSKDALLKHNDFAAEVKRLETATDDWHTLQQQGFAMNSRRDSIIATASQGLRAGVEKPGYDHSGWKRASYPINSSNAAFPAYSIVWLRKEVQLDELDPSRTYHLRLGKIWRDDITYFNGVEIGRGNDYHRDRVYTIPSQLLKRGKNTIAIRVVSLWSGGHLGTALGDPAIYSSPSGFNISLKGDWRYNSDIEPTLPVGQEFQNHPAVLFNAMINPVIPYTIKGAVWYQGESDVDHADRYSSLLSLMVNDWRKKWQSNFPFILVQLPRFGSPASNLNVAAPWAVMREAQASITRLPNTALVCTIDLGDEEDLHPQNKETVARRTYLSAQALAYGKAIHHRGPLFTQMKTRGDTAILFFKTSSKLTCANDSALQGFAIAGKDQQFVAAYARITGDKQVSVWSPQVRKPVAVRYAWANNPQVNLTDKSGLPAHPFRTDSWLLQPQQNTP